MHINDFFIQTHDDIYNLFLARHSFTNEIDWIKVYDGIFNPQNIATHNKRNFINFMSGSVGWLFGSLLGNNGA